MRGFFLLVGLLFPILVCGCQAGKAAAPPDPGQRLVGTWELETKGQASMRPFVGVKWIFEPDGKLVKVLPGAETQPLRWGVTGAELVVSYPDGKSERVPFYVSPDGKILQATVFGGLREQWTFKKL